MDAFTPFHRGGSGSPLVLLHGFTDTWRTWELVLPALEREHEVLAITLPGHAGGAPLDGEVNDSLLADAVEAAMDAVGWKTAHVAGNSLGGYVALQVAARGRADSVVALAPAGGWDVDDDDFRATLDHFLSMEALLKTAAQHADMIVSSPEGRRQATQFISERPEVMSPELVAHLIRGAAACTAVRPLVDYALREGWTIEAERIDCPVRIVWGDADKLLRWPSASVRFRRDWFPTADWVELEGVGHCPQLDVPVEAAELIASFSR